MTDENQIYDSVGIRTLAPNFYILLALRHKKAVFIVFNLHFISESKLLYMAILLKFSKHMYKLYFVA